MRLPVLYTMNQPGNRVVCRHETSGGDREVCLTTGADIVVVYDVDGIVTDCNVAAASLLGYAAPELAGRPMAQIIPPQLRSEHRALIRRLLGSAQVASVNTLRLARDGSEVPVQLTVCPIKDAAGRVMALCEVGGAPSPVPELGVPTSTQWREIFDSITAFVGVMSRDGVVLEVNQAALDAAGLRIADVIRRQVWDTYWWSYSKDAQQQIRAVLESVLKGNPVRQELVVRLKGEQLVAVDCDFRPAAQRRRPRDRRRGQRHRRFSAQEHGRRPGSVEPQSADVEQLQPRTHSRIG
jgi:PAS domain S-box-containing protein